MKSGLDNAITKLKIKWSPDSALNFWKIENRFLNKIISAIPPLRATGMEK